MMNLLKKNLTASLVPHAPYSVSGNLWGKITPFFSGKVVTIHNQETKYEDQFFLKGSGEFVKMYKMMKIDNSFYMPTKVRSIETYFKNLSSSIFCDLGAQYFYKTGRRGLYKSK